MFLPGPRHTVPQGGRYHQPKLVPERGFFDAPPVQVRLVTRGACWNTRGTTGYLRSATIYDEMAEMRYPAQGFRTFLRVREVKP